MCYEECLRQLKRSDELAMTSCLEAAEASPRRDVRQALKLPKKIVRDILLWPCAGNALGLDSGEALIRHWKNMQPYALRREHRFAVV